MIDEYDTTLSVAYGGEKDALNKVSHFLDVFFGAALQGNPSLYKEIFS